MRRIAHRPRPCQISGRRASRPQRGSWTMRDVRKAYDREILSKDVVRIDLLLDVAQPLQCRAGEGFGESLRGELRLEAEVQTVQ